MKLIRGRGSKAGTSLKDFRGFKATIKYEEVIDKYGKETAEMIAHRSPKSDLSRFTPYWAGWVWLVKSRTDENYGGVVWNATNYQLTHLLEKGHLIVNKKGGVGWASPVPHIDPVYKEIKPRFERAMKQAEIEIDYT